MKEAGVTTLVTLDLAVRIGWQPHEEAAVWIQRELEKIGFKINITRQTDATFRQLASKGDLQLSIESWQSWVNDPFFISCRCSTAHRKAPIPRSMPPEVGQAARRELPRAQCRQAPGRRPGGAEDRHRGRRLGHAVVRQLDPRHARRPGGHREALGHLRTLYGPMKLA